MPHHPEEWRYWAMGCDPNQKQTPDLFSTGADLSANRASEEVPGRRSRRTAFPKDLPRTMRYLEDHELDWLLRAVIHEAKRRGRPMPMTEARPTNTPPASSEPIPEANPSAPQADSSAANRTCSGGDEAGAGECRVGRLQGRCYAVTNRPTVWFIPIGRPEGFGCP